MTGCIQDNRVKKTSLHYSTSIASLFNEDS
jgi:hypothetical protein